VAHWTAPHAQDECVRVTDRILAPGKEQKKSSYAKTEVIQFRFVFRAGFGQMAEKEYGGWISLEIFHQPDDPEMIVSKTSESLARIENRNR
jgi:hypothetical protein